MALPRPGAERTAAVQDLSVDVRCGFESWLCYLLAVWPWPGFLTSLSPDKVGSLPPHSGDVKDS